MLFVGSVTLLGCLSPSHQLSDALRRPWKLQGACETASGIGLAAGTVEANVLSLDDFLSGFVFHLPNGGILVACDA